MTGGEESELAIVVRARDQASAELKTIQRHVEDLGDKASKFIGGAVTTATRLATVGVAGLAAAGFNTVKSFNESEAAGAQLNAVLTSTGGAAGVTAQMANDAGALQISERAHLSTTSSSNRRNGTQFRQVPSATTSWGRF